MENNDQGFMIWQRDRSASFTLIEIISALGILILVIGFGIKLLQPDNGVKSLVIAEQIFFNTMNYAKLHALYHHSKIRIMVDVSADSEYSHRRILVVMPKTGGNGEPIMEKQREILLPKSVFFIPKDSIGDVMAGVPSDKYFWDSYLFKEGNKNLAMAFRDIDAIGRPTESASIKPIVYAVGLGSCNVNASNQFHVKFLKNTPIQGGVFLPNGTIITLDSADKIIKLLE
ncbi:MAG: hypothetical protein LBH49_01980 [Puniceicoccales bacterium]|nr:hypothetical protein [Puniceicoccales bacterium]